jgi:two-component system sensor histidine kinase CpxA
VRSLFVKIFIWFCFTLFVGFFASLVATGVFLHHGLFETPRAEISKSGLALSGVTAAEIYERQGGQALADYFRRIEHAGEVKLFLLDESGKELTGAQVPDDAESLAQRARLNKEMLVEGTEQMIMRAMPIRGPKGVSYIILGTIRRPPPRAWTRASIRLIALLFTAGILCYVLARHLSTPLRLLQNTARQLARGDLSARVAPNLRRRRDEIGQLGEDFDRMAERLEDLIDSHQRLLRDISHELRSPLTRLHVALELARQKSGEAAAAALDRIEKESERLNALIGQVLTLGRLEREQEGVALEPVNLTELLEEIVSDADFEARGKNCEVKLEKFESVMVSGHPEILRSAVENVVRNAVRYTPERSHVSVSLMTEPPAQRSVALIRIRDFGPGVPDGELSKIFRPFYRVSESRDRRTGGAGLGLAIALRAVQIHGGNILALNAEGGGLELQIRLPVNIR